MVTPQGVGVCSPAPCPVIHVEYKAELANNPELADWNNRIQAMRTTDPIKAADEAAALIRTCEAARSNAARARMAADAPGGFPVAGPPKERLGKPLPEGYVDAAIKRVDETQPTLHVGEKRAAQIQSGEKDFAIDQPMTRGDIDEPLAVGAPGIKPQRAVDRAMDPHNRQFLDPATNRRTKYTGTDPRDVARGREKLKPVSLKDDPNALFTRRFDETHEMSEIFQQAVDRVQNKGKLTPTQLKNRINREVSDIIKNGTSDAANSVREILIKNGFEFRENIGWIATKPRSMMPSRPAGGND